MNQAPILRVYLEGPLLRMTWAGKMNFLNVLKAAVESRGWRVEWHETGPEARRAAPGRDGYALFHMQPPTHDRALTFRRAYHYPFWRIETTQQRWRFRVAQARFDPDAVDPATAEEFARNLRARVLPGPSPTRTGPVLVPLQGHLRRCRSFQTMSPVQMLEQVAATGRPTVATLHPRERYDAADHAALDRLTARHPNLHLGGDTAALLRDCAFVATQNSGVAFDGYILGKPAVLFGQIDFHHIGLNVARQGAGPALAATDHHAPDYARYLWWFLQEQSINASRPEAPERILAAMRKGGWPI
ncbi:hypothetical protein [Paracoccus aminovorans]|uniref:hypothetical protein n=1 Tax=Paracoccus aminovorans TaxID=34004 RepID=UPI002B26204C|nr:hypothetical protein [Paracoccus aminovorans]